MWKVPFFVSWCFRYSSLLGDCQQCYLSQRSQLLTPCVSDAIDKLAKQYERNPCSLVSLCMEMQNKVSKLLCGADCVIWHESTAGKVFIWMVETEEFYPLKSEKHPVTVSHPNISMQVLLTLLILTMVHTGRICLTIKSFWRLQSVSLFSWLYCLFRNDS